ncbi:MAG TPA: nucleotide exchange factor GrpE [Paludibacteraceae bacterium]|nr:nucleotide exchange factor GrpE [Paludibacteraceae bacterium]
MEKGKDMANNEINEQEKISGKKENLVPQAEKTEENENIEKELERLRIECEELADKNLRLIAEFDNYRKRMLKEKTELLKNASESLLVNLLPLVDDFERALQAIETTDDINAIKEGVQLIYNKFINFLHQYNVKEIPTIHQEFDTQLHEAVSTIPAPNEDLKGKIVDCVLKGYTLNDKVIRHAKVIVGE